MIYKGFVYLSLILFLIPSLSTAKEENSNPLQEFVNVLYSYNYGNYENSYEGLLKYAKLKNVQAQIRLGQSFEKGNGVEPNLVTAYSWYALAAESGNSSARIALDDLKKKMTPVQIKQAEIESKALIASNNL